MVHGNHAQLLLTSLPAVAIANMELTDTGDHITYKVGTSDAAKRYWDRTASFVFQQSTDGVSWTSATAVAIRHVGGYVTLSGVVGGTHQARVQSGAYLPYAAIGDVREWAVDIDRQESESTCMTTNSTPTRFQTWKMGTVGGTFKVGRFLVDDTYVDLLTIYSEDTLIASLVMDVTTTPPLRMEGYCKLKKDGMKVDLNDLEMEDLDFRIDGAFYLVNA